MRALGVLALSISVFIGGCGPIMLRVETPGVEPARLQTHVVKGDKPTVPAECATPCDIQIARGTEHQLSIDAPGCYPAQFNISYDDVRQLTAGVQGAESVLRVPLQRRPAAPGVAAAPVAKDQTGEPPGTGGLSPEVPH